MFTGLHHTLLDEKGRLAFPASLRSMLADLGVSDRFVLTQCFYERCLEAMTEDAFRDKCEKVRALPPSNAAVMEYKRVVIASATVIVVDKHGRVNIPKELREYAELERETVWAGVIDKIELWSKTRLDERSAHRLRDPEAMLGYQAFFENAGL